MSAKHTPGPWTYEASLGHVLRADDHRPEYDALADTCANDLPEEECDANGVLMAAAPDLAARLHQHAHRLHHCDRHDGGFADCGAKDCVDARAALQKAGLR